jgi:signal transduction histidine kinase
VVFAVTRPRRVHPGAEIALVYVAAATFFSVVAVAVSAAGSDAVVALLGAALIAVVAAMARWLGVQFAVPSAMAGLLAYDWYYFPPTHPRAFPDSEDLLNLLGYLAVVVVIGELVAYAARSAAVAEVARAGLAGEQAALRRVATLVATQSPPETVFAAVAREVGRLLDVDVTHIGCYSADGATTTRIASWSRDGAPPAIGGQWAVAGDSVTARVQRTGAPARLDDYDDAPGPIADLLRAEGVRSSVGVPIVVDQHLWGVVIASSKGEELLPGDTEARMAGFTELVATAIANTEARTALGRLADEQAALRRVATLVARQPPPGEVFAAVTEEVGGLLDVDDVTMLRYEPDGTATVVARVGTSPAAARDDEGRAAETGPVVVEERLWGAISVVARAGGTLPPGTESRIDEFTQLVATAISNIEARWDLAASRARIVAATDEERRRVVRDLHDGAQQRLVHTMVTLKLARRALRATRGEDDPADALVGEALEHAQAATSELRELAHGIMPSVLTRGGLRSGVAALASRTPVPVEIDVTAERLPATVEATAYFVVAEALTNVAKHAHASRVDVSAAVEDGELRIAIRDDGDGGARPDGPGLLGLADRLAVLEGRLRVDSAPGAGTLITATIPVGDDRSSPAPSPGTRQRPGPRAVPGTPGPRG